MLNIKAYCFKCKKVSEFEVEYKHHSIFYCKFCGSKKCYFTENDKFDTLKDEQFDNAWQLCYDYNNTT